MPTKYFIDASKAATPVVAFLFIALYNAWENTVAWLYLATHGAYGLLWLIKSRAFPDQQWERPVAVARGVGVFVGLGLYWVTPWLIASGRTQIPGAWYAGMCVMLVVFGVFFHFVSDMQKHMSLLLRPGMLIAEGLWSRLRNPNYFGELLIYLGFTLLAFHWAPLVVLALFVATVWIPGMRRKDRSLSRYPDFGAYRARSYLFIPFVW